MLPTLFSLLADTNNSRAFAIRKLLRRMLVVTLRSILVLIFRETKIFVTLILVVLTGSLVYLNFDKLENRETNRADYDEVVQPELLAQAQQYFDLGQYRSAFFTVNDILQMDGDSTEALLIKSRLNSAIGYSDSVVWDLQDIDDADLSNTDYVETLTMAYINSGNYEQAEKFLSENTSFALAHPNKSNNLQGTLFFHQGFFDRALKAFEKSIDNDLFDFNAQLNILKIYHVSNRREKLHEKLAEMDELFPDEVDFLMEKASIHYALGEYDEALKLFEQVILEMPSLDVITPRRLKLITLLSATLTKQGRQSEPRRYDLTLKEFLDSDYAADRSPMLISTVQPDIFMQNYIIAAAMIDRILPSNQVLAYTLKGDLELHRHRLSQALEHYHTAWNIRASDFIAQKIISIYKKQLDNQALIAFLSVWNEELADSITAKSISVDILVDKNEYATALRILNTYDDRYKSNLWHQINTVICLTNTGQIAEAVSLGKKAYEQDPFSPSTAHAYGWALFQQKEYQQSFELLQKAFKNKPDDIILRGRLEKAKKALAASG